MPLKYVPKVWLIFKLPDGSTHQGFFRQNQKLGEIVSSLWPGGKTELDQEQNIGQLGLKNDDMIVIQAEAKNVTQAKVALKPRWPFREK